MERVRRLIVDGNVNTESDYFWITHWHDIASVKAPLEAKVAAYKALNLRGVVNINNMFDTEAFYSMLLADPAFVTALDLDAHSSYRYRVYMTLTNDDVAALAKLEQEGNQYDPITGKSYSLKSPSVCLWSVLMKINAPQCARFLLQDRVSRESMTRYRMSPLALRLAEELVQPTDQLYKEALLISGQSVKLIGMCVKDEELVAAWYNMLRTSAFPSRGCTSVIFARKLYELATPEQKAKIKTEVLRVITYHKAGDGWFELAWLFGLLGPFAPTIQKHFLRNNVGLFPALTFAMIVAMCDGYLELAHPRTSALAPQRRFFALVTRLPMDVQALVSLRLWNRASTVIQSDMFNRAFLTII
jgi:hypothetical protein